MVIGDMFWRICWVVPSERPTATINAKSLEQLDVCALQSLEEGAPEQYLEVGIPERIAPTENGWDDVREFEGTDEIEAVLRITAKNADPKEVKVRILSPSDSVDNRILTFQ